MGAITTNGHNITFTAQAEEWYCLRCGAKGLDGEHSPLEVPCVNEMADSQPAS